MTLHALSKNYIMIASLTVFYSLIIVLAVTIPFRAALEKRLIEVDKS